MNAESPLRFTGRDCRDQWSWEVMVPLGEGAPLFIASCRRHGSVCRYSLDRDVMGTVLRSRRFFGYLAELVVMMSVVLGDECGESSAPLLPPAIAS